MGEAPPTANGVDGGCSTAERLLNRLVRGELDASLAAPFLAALEVVLAEAARTPRFARALQASLDGSPDRPRRGPVGESGGARRGRRAPGVVDPYAILDEGGAGGLAAALQDLSVEQLKDIIAQHGMDRDRLAMKWRDPSRLIRRIVETASGRASKGDAFRPDHETPEGPDPHPGLPHG